MRYRYGTESSAPEVNPVTTPTQAGKFPDTPTDRDSLTMNTWRKFMDVVAPQIRGLNTKYFAFCCCELLMNLFVGLNFLFLHSESCVLVLHPPWSCISLWFCFLSPVSNCLHGKSTETPERHLCKRGHKWKTGLGEWDGSQYSQFIKTFSCWTAKHSNMGDVCVWWSKWKCCFKDRELIKRWGQQWKWWDLVRLTDEASCSFTSMWSLEERNRYPAELLFINHFMLLVAQSCPGGYEEESECCVAVMWQHQVTSLNILTVILIHEAAQNQIFGLLHKLFVHWTLINNVTGVPGPHLLTPSCSHCVLDGDSEQRCASDFTVEDKMWAHSCAWRAQSEVLHTSAFPVKWWSSFECV